MALFAIAPSFVAGFVPTPRTSTPKITTTTTTTTTTDNFKYYGAIAPTGEFDPLNILTDKNRKFMREAELQHGRVAMLAAVAIPGLEMLNLDSDTQSLGINYLSSMDLGSQLPFWYGLAVVEFYRMYSGWNSPFYGDKRTPFSISDDYQPGNLFRLDPEKASPRLYNTELSNGRLAMLGIAHMIGSELATGENLMTQMSHF